MRDSLAEMVRMTKDLFIGCKLTGDAEQTRLQAKTADGNVVLNAVLRAPDYGVPQRRRRAVYLLFRGSQGQTPGSRLGLEGGASWNAWPVLISPNFPSRYSCRGTLSGSGFLPP